MSTTVTVNAINATVNVHESTAATAATKKAPKSLAIIPSALNGQPVIDSDFFIVWVDAEMAKKLLEANEFNRDLRKNKVAEFLEDMNEGRFFVSPDAITINKKGNIMNGIHRLTAASKTKDGVKVPFLIASNFPEESLAIMDTGTKRTVADHLTFRGHKGVNNRLVKIMGAFYNDPAFPQFDVDFAERLLLENHDNLFWAKSIDHKRVKTLPLVVLGLVIRAKILGFSVKRLERFVKLCDTFFYDIDSTDANDFPVLQFYRKMKGANKQGKHRFDIRSECAKVLVAFLSGKKILTNVGDAEKAFEMPWDKDFVKKEKGAKKTK